MRIHTYDVGPGRPVFVVAEIGSNHGRSLDAALALIDAAAGAGADAVKLQLWIPDKMYDPHQFPDEYASAVKWQLPREWLPTLRDRAHERGMAFGCSAFDFDSLDYVDQFVDFHKVASIESHWEPFVRAVASKNKPVLISVGIDERGPGRTLRWVDDEFAYRTVLMQCTVAYPAELGDADLAVIQLWTDPSDQGFAVHQAGYSDHTTHPTIAPCAAVALGACVIEKHIKLSRASWMNTSITPDEPHSINESEFAEMVTAIRLTEQALGSSEKRIRESERPYLKYRRGPKGLRGS